jgi:lysyl-tRNA synthetase, class II
VVEREDTREPRRRKLEELTALGLPLLPNTYEPTHSAAEVKATYEALEGSHVRVAGRLMRVRMMGKASFAHILDSSGELQLYFKRDVLGDTAYEYFKLLDVGDIIGAEGTVFKTKTGEISVQVEQVVLLAKAYRSLPDKWHGIADPETRYRRRYLDLISNDATRRTFQIRSRALRAIRHFLDERGFVEVETPILQPIYGGAAATPFTARYEFLDQTVYLRIATELYLKRLIVGGFERVYEIGKDFRNEGGSRKHSPEFTMLELYQAYADYNDIMRLMEDMFSTVAEQVLGTRTMIFDEREIDFGPPWRRVSVRDAVLQYAGVDIDEVADRDELFTRVKCLDVPVHSDATRGKLVEELVSSCVEKNLIEPTFLIDYPVDFPGSLLAKRRADRPDLTERFELFIGGMEIANAFTELNDPYDQRERMEAAARLAGDQHAEVDADFLLALEHGMPPTGGVGFGVDRLVMLLAGSHHIRETVLFPLLRNREDDHAEP